jgi:hypothetical protein
MFKKACFLILFSVFFSSCRIEGSFQGLYGYYKITKRSHPELFYQGIGSGLCEVKQNGNSKIAVINGLQLRECIEKCDKSIVYIWSPNCHGRFCYSLDALQRQCDSKGIELFVVAEYYDAEKMGFNYIIEKPVFGIDTEYYKSSKTSKYCSGFIYDLTGRKDVYGKLVEFRNGSYLKSYSEMDSIQ